MHEVKYNGRTSIWAIILFICRLHVVLDQKNSLLYDAERELKR